MHHSFYHHAIAAFIAYSVLLAPAALNACQTAASASATIRDIVAEAFVQTHDGWSVDEVILHPDRNASFLKRCHEMSLDLAGKQLTDADFNLALMNVRKAGQLESTTTKSNRKRVAHLAPLAEMAARNVIDRTGASIDLMMSDPSLRDQFDDAATHIDPDVDLYSVRKAAFQLRKTRRLRPELITRIADWGREIVTLPLADVRRDGSLVPAKPGIYIFRNSDGYLYIGQSINLRDRMKEHLDASSNPALAKYLADSDATDTVVELHSFAPDSQAKATMVRRAYESELIASRKPAFNLQP